jgi:hypothetical protein
MEEQFYIYCKNGCLEEAKKLLETYPQIDMSYKGWSPFRWACAEGHMEVAQWLLSLHDNVSTRQRIISAYNSYAYIFACEGGHLHIAQWLKEIQLAEISRSSQWVAFRYACDNNHFHVVDWICNLDPSLWYYTVEDGQMIECENAFETHEFNKLMLCLDATNYLSLLGADLIMYIYDFMLPDEEP